MPGSTSNIGLPYAIPTDALAAGADAMEELATALDAYLSVSANLGLAAAQTITGGGGGEDIVWDPASSQVTSELTFEPGNVLLTYTGPTRWFAYDVLVEWPSQSAETNLRQVELERNGVSYATNSIGTDSGGSLFTQEIVAGGNFRGGLIRLDTGDQLNVHVRQLEAGDRACWVGLRLKGL